MIDYDSRKYSSEWEPVTHAVPHGSILSTLFFLLYINDLPKIIRDISNPILFAEDTSMIITNSGFHVFKKDKRSIIIQLNRWFKSHLLSLNLDKTHFLQLLTKNSHEIDLQISYENKQISKIFNTTFLGLIIDNNLYWAFYIDETVYKLNKACYVSRSVKPFISSEVLRMHSFSLVQSIISYGINFRGTSSHSKVIFKIQKRMIIIIMNSDSIDSCHELLKKLYILPLHYQYIFSILLLVVKNRGLFKTNFDVHNLNTRSNYDLHLPTAKINDISKRNLLFWYLYHLPLTLKQLPYDVNKFKTALKKISSYEFLLILGRIF